MEEPQEIKFPDEDERKLQISAVVEKIRSLRRYYNNLLNTVIDGNASEYNTEDLARLVGTLEAAYNHALASLAGDGDIYCLLKHLCYALILIGEMDAPDVTEVYDILTTITGGIIEPCKACQDDAKLAIK